MSAPTSHNKAKLAAPTAILITIAFFMLITIWLTFGVGWNHMLFVGMIAYQPVMRISLSKSLKLWGTHTVETPRIIRRLPVSELELTRTGRRFGGGTEV